MESPRYVIQEHTTPTGVHWDWMLEDAGRLLTWRLPVPPRQLGAAPVEAVQIFDHPLRFLTYEGPVQNETGQVRIADAGTYRRVEWDDERRVVQLDGTILSGRFELVKQHETWLLRRVNEALA